MWHWLYLFLGICHAVLSVVIITHIFSYRTLKTDGKNVNSFLNRWVENVEASEWQWAASVIIIFIGWYLMACTLKG